MKRIFIANRGEIARRIALTAKCMGYETATPRQKGLTQNFLHGLIDVFVDVDGLSREHYLSIEKMCSMAKQAGADAVHPGFGFLSESFDFASAVIREGMTWIGPSPLSIEAMASKEGAKNVARKAGVPVNEGVSGVLFESPDFNLKACEVRCEALGFPVLVKAAYGGGGKGMRRVESRSELLSALERCTSEAKRSFGNPLLIIEKYLLNPRHVEVQVLADTHGNIVAVGDRDCSIQRRHQKIIEEAPAPGIDPTVRKLMHESAVKLAEIVKYTSAGTVEFMLTESKGKQDFFFLEMNTRLQVEHPVTEEVFGIDLVEQQLRVAEGLALSDNLLVSDLQPSGHAIEVRVYGEDVHKDFLPTAGEVCYFSPSLGEARWEIGLDHCGQVTSEFDPMIAKVICKSSTRVEAIDKMLRVLRNTHLFGIQSNIEFLVSIFEDEEFRSAKLSTSYLGAAKVTELLQRIMTRRSVFEKFSKDLAQFAASRLKVHSQESQDFFYRWFELRTAGPMEIVTPAEVVNYRGLIGLSFDASFQQQKLQKYFVFATPLRVYINSEGALVSLRRLADFEAEILSQSESSAGSSLAPVPGRVVRINFTNGSMVKRGDTVLVLESMKMEFEIRADTSGVIKNITAQEGTLVQAKARLFEIESP